MDKWLYFEFWLPFRLIGYSLAHLSPSAALFLLRQWRISGFARRWPEVILNLIGAFCVLGLVICCMALVVLLLREIWPTLECMNDWQCTIDQLKG